MVNFYRLWKYILVYIILMIVTAYVSLDSIIHPIDLAVYKEFYLGKYFSAYNEQLKNGISNTINDDINERIIFIDIPISDEKEYYVELRKNITEILEIIDSKVDESMSDLDKPVIILDIGFTNAREGIEDLMFALHPLVIDKNVKIYAPYKLPATNAKKNLTFAEHDKTQNTNLYRDYFGNKRLTTAFYNHKEVDGLVSYNLYEVVGDSVIMSLPVKVANDYKRNESKTKAKTKALKQELFIVPLKLPFDPEIRKYHFEYNTENNAIPENDQPSIDENGTILEGENDQSPAHENELISQLNEIDLSEKIIIIGTQADYLDIGKEGGISYPVPGPYLVALALMDQLKEDNYITPPYDNEVLQLSLILAFAFIVIGIFGLIYKYIKKLQTRPYLIAILSWILGVTGLLFLGYILLEFAIIRPTLPAISMAWAAFLTWHFTKQFLVLGIMEGSGDYDVFISYSRSKSEWVKKYLYNPLKDLNKPDGSKLKIFFDEKEIGIGEHFTTKYMRSIIDSKLFIPVMSEDYYKKNHCRNEMDIAVKRKVEKLIGIFMIAFDYKFVPEEFNHINFIDLNKEVDFISLLKDELIKIDKNPLKTNDATRNSEPVRKPEQVVNSNTVEQVEVKDKAKEPLEKVSSIEFHQNAKGGLDAKKMVLTEANDELVGKGIIIINNGDGNLTITSNGITLTLNGKKEKKKKNKKQFNKKNKKNKKKKGKKS